MSDTTTASKQLLKNPLRDYAAFVYMYFKPHGRRMLGAYLLITITALVGLLSPFLTESLVNVTSDAFTSPDQRRWQDIAWPIIALFSMGVLAQLAMRAAHIMNVHIHTGVQAALGSDSIARIHRFETAWHSDTFAGSIVTAARRGRWATCRINDLICYDFWPALLVMVVSIVLAWQRSIVIGLLFALFTVVMIVSGIILSFKYVAPVNRRSVKEDSRLGGIIADSVSGHAAVKTMGAEWAEDIRIRQAAENFRDASKNAWIRSNIVALIQQVLINIVRLASLLISAWYWLDGRFNGGDVIFIFLLQRTLSDFLERIGDRLREFTEALNDMEDVVYWHTRRPGITAPMDAPQTTIQRGDIIFDKVSFHYPTQDKLVFDHFSLHIKAGEKIAFVGPSGAGKTTLFKLLHRQYDPTDGAIYVDGQPLANMELSSLRAQLTLVPQDPALFHRTLADNIAYGRADATREDIIAAAKAAHIHDMITLLPLGYDTMVGERGVKLSGGERQRVAIARAILMNAPVLLLDEATSALNSETEWAIQMAIAAVTHGRTTLMIAHRLSTIRHADRIAVIDHGRIVEIGKHDELMEITNGRYRRMYETQVRGFSALETA